MSEGDILGFMGADESKPVCILNSKKYFRHVRNEKVINGMIIRV